MSSRILSEQTNANARVLNLIPCWNFHKGTLSFSSSSYFYDNWHPWGAKVINNQTLFMDFDWEQILTEDGMRGWDTSQVSVSGLKGPFPFPRKFLPHSRWENCLYWPARANFPPPFPIFCVVSFPPAQFCYQLEAAHGWGEKVLLKPLISQDSIPKACCFTLPTYLHEKT